MEDREQDFYDSLKGVCKKCKLVMRDNEPMSPGGEFYHYRGDCPNSNKTFVMGDLEIEPFVRKRIRRLDKRNTKNFYKKRKSIS